jgi:hypothetical protein
VCAALAACSGGSGTGAAGSASPSSSTSVPVTVPVTVPPTLTPTAPPTTPPVTVPQFATAVQTVTGADLGLSWREGCPVGPDQLRRVSLSYWGFDGQVRTGALIVHVDVVDAVTTVFASLFAQRFPIRVMEPVDKYGASDDASMDADNTSAFNCRMAVTSGPPSWSQHAFGKAIDVNPVENPYLEAGRVLPPAGRDYLDRANVRPGMAVAGGPLVEAFAAVGWQWGGRPGGFTDYQHFSATGG